jgi:hypothetical protein
LCNHRKLQSLALSVCFEPLSFVRYDTSFSPSLKLQVSSTQNNVDELAFANVASFSHETLNPLSTFNLPFKMNPWIYVIKQSKQK